MSTPRASHSAKEDGEFVGVRMNDDAVLYQNSSPMQNRDGFLILREYAMQMKWRHINDRTLDIGCGDGSLTNALKNYIPKNFETLIGCDINEKMIKYANNHYADERTKFKVLNIEGNLPKDLRNNFDHVFSFYALHWIKNQEKAFTNIFNLLSKDGDCLLTFLAHMPLYTPFYVLSQSKKWGFWLQTYTEFESPYHASQEPAEFVTVMMKKIGFRHIDVKCKQMKYIYNNVKELKNTVAAINPFKIPKENLDDFLEDFVTVAREMRLVNNEPNHENSERDATTVFYNLIVVYAGK